MSAIFSLCYYKGVTDFSRDFSYRDRDRRHHFCRSVSPTLEVLA